MSDDDLLEQAIDAAGRDAVFAKARELGWDACDVPRWVWWGIVRELTPKD